MSTKVQVSGEQSAETVEVAEVRLLSPYQCAAFVNALLADAGVEKVLPPQMFYTYVRKGYIAADENKKVTLDTITVWAATYLQKQGVVLTEA